MPLSLKYLSFKWSIKIVFIALLFNLNIVRCKNKFLSLSKAQYTKSGFTKSYLVKEFEKIKFTDRSK